MRTSLMTGLYPPLKERHEFVGVVERRGVVGDKAQLLRLGSSQSAPGFLVRPRLMALVDANCRRFRRLSHIAPPILSHRLYHLMQSDAERHPSAAQKATGQLLLNLTHN